MRSFWLFVVVFCGAYLALTAVYGADLKGKELPLYSREYHGMVAADCESLRELQEANKNRKLSDEEKIVKAQLVRWHKQNCKKTGR